MTAEPTAFHHMLRALDDRGRLLRVYTQNIDALELKSGLTFGVPELEGRRSRPRALKGKSDSVELPAPLPSTSAVPRLLTPPAETPRCIPLHGTLQSMHCQICQHTFPLENYLDDLNAGSFPICPDCDQVEETRQAVGKRSRGVGKLRPSVVLYNEMHKDGEEVGEVVRRDLIGGSKGKGRAGADLLLVVGTSLRVPGTKRMVREFSKAVHSRYTVPTQNEAASAESSSLSALPSPRRTPAADEDAPIKTIYLNLDFPVPTREWEGVFDVWIRGDAQTFASLVHEEIVKEEQAKEAAIERKRRREELKEEARVEEERRRLEVERLANAKSKKTKGKSPSKAASGHGRKRRDSSSLPTPPRSVKRQKIQHQTQASPRKPSNRPKQHRVSDPSQEKLTIKIPPRSKPSSVAVQAHEMYTPPTPPSSQPSRLVPEVVITTTPHRPRTYSSHPATLVASPSLLAQPYYFSTESSPLSTPPITPPYHDTSPLSPRSSSTFSSPLTSLLSSPAATPMRSPPYSPLGSPPPPPRRRRSSAQMIHKHANQVTRNPGSDDTEDEVDIDGGVDGIPAAGAAVPKPYELRDIRPRNMAARF